MSIELEINVNLLLLCFNEKQSTYRHNYTYCFKANTNSSIRVKLGADYLDNYKDFNEYQLPSRLYIKKKTMRLESLKTIHCYDTMIDSKFDVINKKICFDPNIDNAMYVGSGHKEYYPVHDLEVIDVVDGIQCKDMNGIIQFLLLPREISISNTNKHKLMETLSFLSENRPQLNRGDSRSNNFYDENHSYVIIGKSVNRFGKGSKDSNLQNDKNSYYKNRITKVMRSMENKVKMFLDTKLIQSLNFVKNDVIGYDTMSNSNQKRTQIWSSLSHAVNYNSVSHVDEDFFLSSCSVNEESKKEYELHSNVITYFCFPTLRKAIALRDGDILIFNPLTYHCCSKKNDCITNNVHIYSLYLKSKHVSQNDNSKILTEFQRTLWEKKKDK